MIKNIVFDLGRVLVEFSPAIYLERFGLGEETNQLLNQIVFHSEEWVDCDRGKYENNTDIKEILCEKHPEHADKIRLVLTDDWVEMLLIKPETVKFLETLKNDGYKIFILSNLSKQSLDYLSKYDFFKLVDGGVYSYQVHLVKPDPAVYSELLNKYALVPEETIFIDDLENNIKAAKDMNIHGVVFKNIEQVEKEVNELIESNS